jgi:hypothetical protein
MSPRLDAQTESTGQRSVDFIPEINAREGQDEFHTGVSRIQDSKESSCLTLLQRGGAGNVYKEKHGGHSHSQSPDRKGLGEKVKEALHLDKSKKHESSPLAQNDPASKQ